MLTKQTDAREILDVLMDSRLYYDLSIRERLILVKHLMSEGGVTRL